MSRYLIGAALTLALLGGAYGRGWSDRGAQEAARAAALGEARARDAARIAGMAQALARAQAEQDRLARELEDAALQDMDATRRALGVDSVRRIDRR